MVKVNRRSVVFHRGASPYTAGDVAVFEESQAKAYVDGGVAKYNDRQMVPDRHVVGLDKPERKADVEQPKKADATDNPKAAKKAAEKAEKAAKKKAEKAAKKAAEKASKKAEGKKSRVSLKNE